MSRGSTCNIFVLIRAGRCIDTQSEHISIFLFFSICMLLSVQQFYLVILTLNLVTAQTFSLLKKKEKEYLTRKKVFSDLKSYSAIITIYNLDIYI